MPTVEPPAAPTLLDLPAVEELYGEHPTARTGGGTPYVNIADAYVAWVTYVNGGMLNRGNLLCFDYAMRHLAACGTTSPMVEIGVFAGLSTNLLAYYRRRHGVTVPYFNCDGWQYEGADGFMGDSPIGEADYRAFVMQSYRRNVEFFSAADRPHTIEALSDDFFARWNAGRAMTDLFGRRCTLGGPISFCYVDGDHSYAASKSDFENADRWLEVGGMVLFDDSADGTKFECGRLMREILELPNYRLVVKNPNYMFQKVA